MVQHPCRIKKLEQVTEMTRSSASRHILVLTERGDKARSRVGLGLVTTYEDEEDARVKRVKLTSKGERLLADITKIMET